MVGRVPRREAPVGVVRRLHRVAAGSRNLLGAARMGKRLANRQLWATRFSQRPSIGSAEEGSLQLFEAFFFRTRYR